jgi:hypothetical protein
LEIGKLRNQLWNAFKHATDRKGKDRDDDELFAKFRSDDNEHFLFLGWYDYGQAGFSLPVEAQVFQTWYLAKYPEKLDPSADFSTMRSFFPQLTSQPRDHQRARLTAICQRARSDNSLMSSPMTDLRPLILP